MFSRAEKGFTILEALISMTVMLLILSSLTVLIIQLVRNGESFSIYCENHRNSVAALDTMAAEIRAARQVDPLASSNKLILDNSSYTIAFDLSGGKVRRTKNSSVSYLTPDWSVDDLYFSYPSNKSALMILKPAAYPSYITSEAAYRN